MSIFDTHSHYNLEPLWGDGLSWQTHWQAAQQAGVIASVVVGTEVESSQRAVEIATTVPGLWAAVGIHPTVYNDLEKDNFAAQLANQLKALEALLSHPKVVAVGETGLDYFHLPATADHSLIKAHQQEALAAQLKLALAHDKTLILHVRDRGDAAYQDVLDVLQAQAQLPRTILHCVSGPIPYLQAALKLGVYIGVAGNITYHNADHIRSLVRLTPPDQILLETDAPYLPPQTHRGQVCQPAFIAETAEYLAEDLGLNLEQILANSYRAFAISPAPVQ